MTGLSLAVFYIYKAAYALHIFVGKAAVNWPSGIPAPMMNLNPNYMIGQPPGFQLAAFVSVLYSLLFNNNTSHFLQDYMWFIGQLDSFHVLDRACMLALRSIEKWLAQSYT